MNGSAIVILIGISIAFEPTVKAFSNPYRTFRVASGSMQPTLLPGEHFVASSRSYRDRAPARGDVVLYYRPGGEIFLHRIVGLPGERIQMVNGVLQIDGKSVARERMEDFIQAGRGGHGVPIKRWRETLPNGVSHMTLDLQANSFYDNTPVHTVPPDHYFMLGDNRDNATDSRAQSHVGFIASGNILGRVLFIYFSADQGEAAWKIWRWIRWNRLFTAVR
jgi:signal peptidase I